jgi:hypothetical protein
MDLTDFRQDQSGSRELLADRSARSSWRISRVACEFPLSRAIVITPVEPMRSGCVRPRRHGLPLSGGGSASTRNVFGACSTFTRVMARRLAELPRQPFDVEGSRPFVASRSAPTASWGTTSFQVWDSHPQEFTDLSTAHTRSVSEVSVLHASTSTRRASKERRPWPLRSAQTI